MNITSVKTRFLVSIVTNALRSVIGFFTGLLVARGLSPAGYGELTFLLGSFTAIRALLDMGSSNAFYTFISQRRRSHLFYISYYSWLAIQFLVAILLVAVVLPSTLVDQFWLGNSRNVILLAFVASFMQAQVWSSVVQIFEALRQTVKVQILTLCIITLHLVLILLMLQRDLLSVPTVLGALICEHVLAIVSVYWFSRRVLSIQPKNSDFSLRKMFIEYWEFCRHMVILALFTFLYLFADRWLLQRFGGADQQGFYQISAKFSAISLLATSSILNIFWKEIAEANARQDQQRVASLYKKVNRGLLMLGAVFSCFLIPWSESLVIIFLGPAYQAAWPVLAVMLFYPIHQSMGQVNGTMFMACGRTRAYMKIGILGMVVSIPASYYVLAPIAQGVLSGMALGALGLAIKMVVISVIFVNIQAWMIARFHGWEYEWKYQALGVTLLLGLGYLAKIAACSLSPKSDLFTDNIAVFFTFAQSGLLYSLGVCGLVWLWPTFFGLEREELQVVTRRFFEKIDLFA